MADYSIWVVEYARVNEFAQGLLLYGQWNAGTTIAPYCYAVLKSEDHLAVIDSGYNHAEFGKVLADWLRRERLAAGRGRARSGPRDRSGRRRHR